MKPTLRLLYAEDNPQDVDLTRACFAERAPEFELQIVATGAACLEQIQLSPPDLLLLDHHLPDTESVTLLRQAPDLPVVVVTGAGDEALVVCLLSLGAAHYVPKQGNYLETLPELLHDVLAEHRRKLSQGLPASNAPQHILYVEHLPMDIDLTVRHFAEAAPNFTVDVALTCAEALARLTLPHAYDLVLIDLRMPDQDGLDFFREAKHRVPQLPPCILISGHGDEATALAALKLGAADYIIKRDGYLNQLVERSANAIIQARLSRLNAQLVVELNERKQAEEKIHQLNADLELRVTERTAQLRAANQEMESFAYSVSHDLRAPLRSIDGFSLALLEDYGDKLDDEGKDYLRRVRAATQKMAQLIDDILKLSRVTRAELASETVNLSAMAVSIAEELRRDDQQRKVEFVIKDDVITKGDPRLLTLVLENLLGNAWKFTSGHAEARIEFGISDIDGKTAYFVRDDGAGFDMKYVDKLFTTFQRLHSELEFPGTGVGLTLVKHIIHRHGGTIWAEGAVDQGATFWFTVG